MFHYVLFTGITSFLWATAHGGVANIASMTQDANRNFVVICAAGGEEVATAAQIRADAPCGGPTVNPLLVSSGWTISGHYSHWDCGSLYAKAAADGDGKALSQLVSQCLKLGYGKPRSIEATVQEACEYEDEYRVLKVTHYALCQALDH